MTDAPLFTIPGQPEPMGGRAVFWRASDGINIRIAHWPAASGTKPRGTAFLFSGRTEFIEKYADAALALSVRGFQVIAMDWRGQGLSDRLLPDAMRGHISDFADFSRDIDAVSAFAQSVAAPKPWIVVAHSMGGHNVLRQAALSISPFDAMALSAPMCRVHLPKPSALIKAVAAWGAQLAPRAYAFGQGPSGIKEDTFENNTLTSDPARFAVMVEALRIAPRLRLGGVTFAWLASALASMAAVLRPGAAERISMPVMIAAAMADQIVDPSIYPSLVPRLVKGRLIPIDGAQHEILREADLYRDQFWTHFDAFMAEHGI